MTGSGPGYGDGREALLKAVIKVTARDGLRGVTYRAVAAEAGVTHGLVRHHFGNWQCLVEEALSYSVARTLRAAQADTGDGTALARLLDDLAGMVDQDPENQIFQYELILEMRRRDALAPQVGRLYARYQAAVVRALSGIGINSSAMAHLVACAIEGLVFRQISGGTPDDTREAVAILRQLLALQRQAEAAPADRSEPRRDQSASV